MESKSETIVFGGGCFWCTDAVFSMFKGVLKTTAGYAGGAVENPTYKRVCEGDTGHAEVLKIDYDPKIISLNKLLDIFFSMHDPTFINRQDADVGTQYRSMILYDSEEQREIIEKSIKQLRTSFEKPIVTEVEKFEVFYPAEEHHQSYYKKHPHQPYCMMVIAPKVHKIKKKYGLS